ncbi:fatty-acyl-CoA synthase [Virgisporangium aliadipatigenens]|uniref:Fatty-acyl-CoA synthase n=1 Tax=Virgisporangium aliadipatigenens TaxID=741659 RepID=A0A8J4DTP6_9ACTN|nr:class I adenylate-forming enzyme family protein [Virgisporangium aliadipatigenens]GIJ50425.1 fatty-acyl-CoA synthase [Virgisporangium aliadipatigenens]
MLAELAHRLGHSHPDRPALLGTNLRGAPVTRIRRGELAELAAGYAAAMHHSGLSTGDTVGVAVRPGPRALAIMLAAHRLGLRVAVLDPSAGPDVLAARLAVARPAKILADAAAQAVAGWARPLARRAGLALPDLAALASPSAGRVSDVDGAHGRRVRTIGRWVPGCAPVLAPRRPGEAPAPRDLDGDAVIIFTSGTTSRPRAVVHTRASLDAGMRAVTALVEPVPGDTVVGGMFFVILPALAAGAPVSLPSRSPKRLVRQVARAWPQATYLTPPQLRAFLDAGGYFPGGTVYSGSAPVSAALLGRVRGAGAARAFGVYALTELFPAAAVEAAEKADFTGDGDLVGAPLPGVTATLDDGELLLAGPSAADRYLGEEPTGVVRTGDAARIQDGRIVLAGRRKDMILRHAENIYPGLYEPALHVPGVSLALLVGVPAGDGDERLVAVVETQPHADRNRVRAALTAPLERMGAARPDRVLFAPVPVSGRSRKPDRRAAAELAAAALAGKRSRG